MAAVCVTIVKAKTVIGQAVAAAPVAQDTLLKMTNNKVYYRMVDREWPKIYWVTLCTGEVVVVAQRITVTVLFQHLEASVVGVVQLKRTAAQIIPAHTTEME